MSELENWNEFSATALTYVKTGSMDEIDSDYVKRMITKGKSNPSRQSRIALAVRETVRDYEDNPFGTRGFSLPAKAQTILDDAIAALAPIAEAFDDHKAVRALILPHGKCNYSHYTDGAHYLSTVTAAMTKNAVSMFKDETWNGSVKSLNDTIGGSL